MRIIIFSLLIMVLFTGSVVAKDTAKLDLMNLSPAKQPALGDDSWRFLSHDEVSDKKENLFFGILEWTLHKSMDICYFLNSGYTYNKIDFLESQIDKLRAYKKWLKDNYDFKLMADVNSFAVSFDLYTKKW